MVEIAEDARVDTELVMGVGLMELLPMGQYLRTYVQFIVLHVL
jgi:hypothetical protein